jgi:hypothetical protein
MIKVVFALSLFLVSCGPVQQMTKLPFFDSAWQLQTSPFPPRQDVSTALKLFYNYWAFEFGDENQKLSKAFNNLMVEWREESRAGGTGHSITGVKITDGIVKGVALSPGYIWVWKGKTEKISATAFVHELMHIALWSVNGQPDADHEGKKYKGWTPKHTEFMHKINYLLAERGL